MGGTRDKHYTAASAWPRTYYTRTPAGDALAPLGNALIAVVCFLAYIALVVVVANKVNAPELKIALLVAGLPIPTVGWFKTRRALCQLSADLNEFVVIREEPSQVVDVTQPPVADPLRLVPPAPPPILENPEETKAKQLARLMLERDSAGLPATRDSMTALNICTPSEWNTANTLLKIIGLKDGYHFTVDDPQARLLIFDERAADKALEQGQWL